MAKNKKKRLVLDVDPKTFDMLKALQRLLGLNSAEEVLLYAGRMLAKAVVSDPLLAMFGASSPTLSQSMRDADHGDSPPKEDPAPAHIGTNLGDKLRNAINNDE